MSSSFAASFNIIVVGDGGVGKTTYINRYTTGEFTTRYNPTLGVECTPLSFYTEQGKVTFNCYDYGKDPWNAVKVDAAIIMFDVTSESSYYNIGKWYQFVIDLFGKIPIVLCGNKVDSKQRSVKTSDITFHRFYNIMYFDVSAKSNYNFEKPFLALCRRLMHDTQLNFVEVPPVFPPVEVPLSV